jgi:methyl-accepting chemotaxis protein
MQWFYDLGIKKKVFAIFGTIIVATLMGIVIIPLSFSRVQVGGKLYRGIQLKRDAIDYLADARSNINLIRGHLYSQALAYDNDVAGEINALTEGTESIFKGLSALRADSGDRACGSCHSGETISAVFSRIGAAHDNWLGFNSAVNEMLHSLAGASGGIEDVRTVLGNEFEAIYAGLMMPIDEAQELLKAASPLQIESVRKEVGLIMWGLILGGIATIVFLLVTASIITSLIVRPVREVARLSASMADGDFKEDVEVGAKGRDEIGEMSDAFKKMCTNLRQTTRQIMQSTQQIVSASEDISTFATDLDTGSQEQAQQTEQVATAMTEMSQTIMDVAKNASDASNASEQAVEVANYGKDTSGYTIKSIQSGAAVVNDASEIIENLGARSREIGEIVTVITEIADQTNLLALNAAIEAARAGEQGRGFAVVADEVRKLAERTAKATREITAKIGLIQSEAEKSVESTRKSKAEIDKGVQLINAVSQSYDSIVSSSKNASDMVQMIAAASEEQSTAAEQVSQNMENISGISRNASKDAARIKDAASKFVSLADEFRRMIQWFKV